MELADKVKQRRIELGLSQEELAQRMGYSSRSSINKIENGRAVSQKIIAKLADALEVTVPYLMGWEDTKADPSYKAGYQDGIKERMQNLSVEPVPVFSAISCGTGSWISENPEDYVGIPDEMLSRSGNYFANKASGDSMEPKIHNGDYVIFEKTPSLSSGAIGSFALNGEYFCKRFKRMPDGSMWLFSENPLYDPILIHPEDDFRVLGKYKLRITQE